VTEAGWQSCGEPEEMLSCLGRKGLLTLKSGGHRRLRLWVAACYRRAWDCFSADERRAVEVAEEQAEKRKRDPDAIAAALRLIPGMQPQGRYAPARSAATFALTDRPWDAAGRGPRNAASAVAMRQTGGHWPPVDYAAYFAATKRELAHQADLLRDVFGDPFRSPAPPPSAAWLAWNDGAVPALAKGIYEDRAFDRMPILADALEEAGCAADGDLLSHLRSPGPHVRGCWALDLVLGKR
jgi:hypothetical protein